MKFILTLAAAVATVSAFKHEDDTDFAGCWTCKCGDTVCEHHESNCIFDKIDENGEITKDEGLEYTKDFVHNHFGMPYGPSLTKEASAMNDKIFNGGVTEVNKEEFFPIYMRIRDEVRCNGVDGGNNQDWGNMKMNAHLDY